MRLTHFYSHLWIFIVALCPSLQAAEKFAAIEIGGSNVKFVRASVEIDNGKARFVEIGDSKVANPGLAAGLGKDKKFDTKTIKATAEIVGSMVKQLVDEHDVPAEHVVIVGSSGIADAVNRQELEDAIFESTERKMEFITAETEVLFTLLGVVPTEKMFQATLVDIGSGNTKWGHLTPTEKDIRNSILSAQIPLGTKSLESAVREKVGAFAEHDTFMKEAKAERKVIAEEIKKRSAASAIESQPEFYVSGGAFWALVTLVKPKAIAEDYVLLSAEDFRRFDACLTPDGEQLFNVDLKAISDDETRKRADNELRALRNVFQPEQIVAGGQILLALVEGLEWEDPETRVYFARHGYKAWITGYLKEFTLKNSKELRAAVSVAGGEE